VVVDDPVKELEDELKYYKSKLEMVGAATAEVRQTNAGLGKEVADLKELYTQTRRRDVAYVVPSLHVRSCHLANNSIWGFSVLDEQTKVLQRQMNITQRDINVMEKTIQKLIRQGERYKTNTVALMLVMQHMMKETEELRATYDNEKQDMTADNLQYAFEILMRKLLEKISGIDILFVCCSILDLCTNTG
jgi:septal ring factor EnvC (AmiA/AmiB activator)